MVMQIIRNARVYGDFFIAGLQYHQHEPVWGGTEDTAIDLRVSCAMGLANSAYPRALIALIPLLYDDYAQARQGAVRAIAFTTSDGREVDLAFGDGMATVPNANWSWLPRMAPPKPPGAAASVLRWRGGLRHPMPLPTSAVLDDVQDNHSYLDASG